jgi:hypothetical protein
VRLFVAWVLVVVGALGVAWLLAGRLFSIFLDRFLTVRVAAFPLSALRYDGGSFRIANLLMTFASLDNMRSDVSLHTDTSNHVILLTGGRAFTLGPRTNPADPAGRPDIDLVADPGDRVSFSTVRSTVGWPTPFEFSFMRPHSPWWKRYVYYRLDWQKSSGAKLEMLWRYQQDYVTPTGWTEPTMMYNWQTGLLHINIRLETFDRKNVVAQYIARTKGWNASQYRIEERGTSPDGRSDVIAVVHLDDERSPHPGAGKSVELYLDRTFHEVTKELGGQ